MGRKLSYKRQNQKKKNKRTRRSKNIKQRGGFKPVKNSNRTLGAVLNSVTGHDPENKSAQGADLNLQGFSNKGGESNNAIAYGKIYADWCGHCQNLNRDHWPAVEKKIGGSIKCYNISDKNQEKECAEFNEKYNTDLKLQGGYPTIFKLKKHGGKVEYYNGERTSVKIIDWLTSESDNDKTHGGNEPSANSENVPATSSSGEAPVKKSWWEGLFSTVSANAPVSANTSNPEKK